MKMVLSDIQVRELNNLYTTKFMLGTGYRYVRSNNTRDSWGSKDILIQDDQRGFALKLFDTLRFSSRIC